MVTTFSLPKLNPYTSYFFGCRHWAKLLAKELRNEALGGAPFFPFKCFPPKSVKFGPISLFLSICRVGKYLLSFEQINKAHYECLSAMLNWHTLLIFPFFKWYRIPDQLIDWEKWERKAETGYKKLSTSSATKICSIAKRFDLHQYIKVFVISKL